MNIKKFVRRTVRAIIMAFVLSMFFIFSAVTLPDNPSTSAAAVGKDFLLFVNTGTVQNPVWTQVGGQRNSPLGRTADSIDVSHKTSGGWKSIKAGMRGWNIDLDTLVLLTDLGIEALETAFMEGKDVNVKFVRPDGKYYTGWAAVTDFSIDPPHDGEASISGSLEGNGALSNLTDPSAAVNSVTPETDAFSKAAPEDLAFTVSSTGTVDLTQLKIGAAIVNTSNYGYSAGVLTIEGDYLTTLANGEKIFTLVMSEGNNPTVTITVGD